MLDDYAILVLLAVLGLLVKAHKTIAVAAVTTVLFRCLAAAHLIAEVIRTQPR